MTFEENILEKKLAVVIQNWLYELIVGETTLRVPERLFFFVSANSSVIVLWLPLHKGIRKWSWEHLSLDHFFCSLPTFQDFGGRVINPLTKKRDIPLEQGLLSPHQCQLSTYLKQMYMTCTLQNSADFFFSFYSLYPSNPDSECCNCLHSWKRKTF